MFIRDVLGCNNYAAIPPDMVSRVLDPGPAFSAMLLTWSLVQFQRHIPELETPLSERVRAFIDWLQDNRAFSCMIHVVRYAQSVDLERQLVWLQMKLHH